MTLDITKPMRVKQTHPIHTWRGKRFYPANIEDVAHFESAGIIKGDEHWRIVDLNYLENIPESVKHEVYLRAERDRVSLIHCATGYKATPNLAKLTVWRDEEGKTHVEIPKEESCK